MSNYLFFKMVSFPKYNQYLTCLKYMCFDDESMATILNSLHALSEEKKESQQIAYEISRNMLICMIILPRPSPKYIWRGSLQNGLNAIFDIVKIRAPSYNSK